MKIAQLFKVAMVGFVMTMGLGVQAADGPEQKDIQIGISEVFVPGGFDSTSDVFVVASGIFPNGCYRWKDADVRNVDAYTHEVKATASVVQGMCLMVLVPFSKEIRMGKFAPGKHALRFLNGDGTYLEKTLNIEE
jgi:hypothetical protein